MKRLNMQSSSLYCRCSKFIAVDAAGNPWNGSWVYSHGNLISDLLDNVVLESTGVLQKLEFMK